MHATEPSPRHWSVAATFIRTGLKLILAGALLAATPNGSAKTLAIVDSIQDLRNYSSPSFDEVVMVLDYYPISNIGPNGNARSRGRGGGFFRWIRIGNGHDIVNADAADDGGRYIRHSNSDYSDGKAEVADGIWERNFQGEIPNVKMWGARGDGSDDTEFIRNAVKGVRWNNAVRGNPHFGMGAELLFPAGVYLVSDTIQIVGGIHLRGEATEHGTRIVMKDTVLDKNIFETVDASVALKGTLRMMDVPGRGRRLGNSPSELVDFVVGLIIENMSFSFGTNQAQHYRTNVTGSAICLSQPAETTVIRNVFVRGGGYGVRVLGGGTPGLQLENLGLFYQAVAGVCIEGLKYNEAGTPVVLGNGGPIHFKNVSGDSFSYHQSLQNSLILFSNYNPNATIVGMSVEGAYGQGAIRCIMPPNVVDKSGEITVIGATYNGNALSAESGSGSIERTFVVLENPYDKPSNHTRCMPLVAIHPSRMYNVANLIWDKWMKTPDGGRKVKALKAFNNQLPIRRPIYYFSAVTGRNGPQEERRSLLVVGDTAYYSFTPVETGWYRVISSPQYFGAKAGGRLAINSYFDSAEVSFTISQGFSDINVLRKSSTVNNEPLVTKVRAYSYFDHSGPAKGVGFRCALDILVSKLSTHGQGSPTYGEYDSIELTLPLEGRDGELGSGLSSLADPIKVSEARDNKAIPDPAPPRESIFFSGQSTPTLIVH